MRIKINENIVEIPNSLAEIKLGQRIAFHNEYGKLLEERLKDALDLPEGILRDLAIQEYHDECALYFFAFFTDCSIESVKQDVPAEIVLAVYYSVFINLIKDENSIELRSNYQWNGEEWLLQSPVLNGRSTMTFGEFIDAKQILKDLVDDQGSRWDFLLKACCIFLRRKEESYDSSFIEEGSDRSKLMESLPMDIALEVGFFLISSIGSFRSTIQSSTQEKVEAVITPLNISISGDGSTS